MFVTLLYCILDFKTGSLKYSAAGQLTPIMIDQDGVFMDIPVLDALMAEIEPFEMIIRHKEITSQLAAHDPLLNTSGDLF